MFQLAQNKKRHSNPQEKYAEHKTIHRGATPEYLKTQDTSQLHAVVRLTGSWHASVRTVSYCYLLLLSACEASSICSHKKDEIRCKTAARLQLALPAPTPLQIGLLAMCPCPISVSKIVCKTGACQCVDMLPRWRVGLHIPSLSCRLRCCKPAANLLYDAAPQSSPHGMCHDLLCCCMLPAGQLAHLESLLCGTLYLTLESLIPAAAALTKLSCF